MGLARARRTVSFYAIPLFLWFSTRLFASIRISLNLVYDAPRRSPGQHFVLGYLAGKLRDVAMVLLTVLLFAANTLVTAAVAVVDVRSRTLRTDRPWLGFLPTSLGHWLSTLVALAFALVLFYVIYRHASPRRLPRRAAFAASVFAALLFEVAKRLYGWYLSHVAMIGRYTADVNIGALVLFVLWLYYTAVVLLIGAVVAETWDLRARQKREIKAVW